MFKITDSGVGIKKDKIDKLQIAYNTFNDDGINSEGTGLGLFICKEIIKDLGPMSEIQITSEYG